MIPRINLGSVPHLEYSVTYAINTTILYFCMSAEQPQKRPQSQAKQQSQAKSTPSYSKFRQRRQGTQYGKRDQLHEIDYGEDDYDSSECFDQDMDSQFENFVIETQDVNQNNIKDEIHVTAVIENTPFELKVDSGAKCNVISTSTIKSLSLCKKPQLNTKKKVKLVTYSKDTIETMGTCVLNCKKYLTSQAPSNSRLYDKIRNQFSV